MLNNLTEGVMYMLLVYWLGPLRPLLEGEPSLRWFLERFESLRGDMQTLRRNPQAAIEAARLAATRLDLLHDDRLRALWFALLALELAADDPARRAKFKDARERILDRGLKMVNASYVDEAAEADLVMGRIDAEVLDVLRGAGFDQGTALDLFEAWRAAARELGEVDRARTRIEIEFTTNERGAYTRLRGEWMKAVKAFRMMVSLVDPHTAGLLTEKLDEMEKRADVRVALRRAQSGAAADEPEGEGEGESIFPADGSDGRAAEEDPDAAEMAEEMGVGGEPAAPEQPAAEPPADAPADGGAPPLRPIR